MMAVDPTAAKLQQAMAYIALLERERDDARLIGHRDGIVTAMLAVRRRIGPIKETLRRTPSHHVKILASAQHALDMLTKLDAELDQRRGETKQAMRDRQAVEIVSPYRPEPTTKVN